MQAHGRQPPILAVSLFLKMLVRCPTVLQADVSLPLNVRSEIEVKRDVDLIATINVYPADQLVDNHLLRFKVGTVVQVSIKFHLVSNKKHSIRVSLALYGESQCCAGINHATARAEQSYIIRLFYEVHTYFYSYYITKILQLPKMQ